MKLERYFFTLMSFLVVGLGQILKGEGEKGLKFILVFYFTLPLLLYLSLSLSGGLFLMVFGVATIFAVIFWIYNIIDAYRPTGQ
jgi:hypothetical protein